MLIKNKELLSRKSNVMQLTLGSTYLKQIFEFLNKDHWD
jgi:hypothetical protein